MENFCEVDVICFKEWVGVGIQQRSWDCRLSRLHGTAITVLKDVWHFTIDVPPDPVVINVVDAEPDQQLIAGARDLRVVHAAHQLLKEIELVLERNVTGNHYSVWVYSSGFVSQLFVHQILEFPSSWARWW